MKVYKDSVAAHLQLVMEADERQVFPFEIQAKNDLVIPEGGLHDFIPLESGSFKISWIDYELPEHLQSLKIQVCEETDGLRINIQNSGEKIHEGESILYGGILVIVDLTE